MDPRRTLVGTRIHSCIDSYVHPEYGPTSHNIDGSSSNTNCPKYLKQRSWVSSVQLFAWIFSAAAVKVRPHQAHFSKTSPRDGQRDHCIHPTRAHQRPPGHSCCTSPCSALVTLCDYYGNYGCYCSDCPVLLLIAVYLCQVLARKTWTILLG